MNIWHFQSRKLLLTRVRRDPSTRPVPNFFSSTRPVPTRKLKMTGYRVIKFHFESIKTRPRMRNPAYEVTNPINPSTGNHFFVICWVKWTRTGAVISPQCLRPIDLKSLRLFLTITRSSTLSGFRFAFFGVTVFPAAQLRRTSYNLNCIATVKFCDHIVVS